MHDRVLGLVIFVPVAIIVLLILSMALIDYIEEDPVNPVGSIPKVILDHHDNETIVTVKAVGERRYDAIHINHTVANESHNLSVFNRYVLDTTINSSVFVLNITVIRGTDHYLYNCSVQVNMNPNDPDRFLIREEEDEVYSPHRSPFKTIAEWREVK
jgi:hypothetical protein